MTVLMAPLTTKATQFTDPPQVAGDQPLSSQVRPCIKNFIIWAEASDETWYLNFAVLVCVCSCGSCREVCIFWDIFEPYNVLDGSSWSVHGQCRRQCEYVVWHGHVAASFRSLCCRLFSWPLPDYYCRFSHLHLG